MTNLQRALEIYDRRSQFHDRPLLEKIIEAVREQEKKKYERIYLAAKIIVEEPVKSFIRGIDGEIIEVKRHG